MPQLADHSIRQKITSTLVYPRRLVGDQLDLDHCRHSGLYNSAARDCQDCDTEPECEWLYDTEEFLLLQKRPMKKLVEALEFALGYMGGEIARVRHHRQRCGCEMCVWLRGAQRLCEEIYDA
ncbi:MAG: hypothetical protein V3S33_08460 [Gammaproteobacteria bacterium]